MHINGFLCCGFEVQAGFEWKKRKTCDNDEGLLSSTRYY